jgi:hypothetical protein
MQAEEHFNKRLRILREGLSVFEQYRLYPFYHEHIPYLWKYRIIAQNGQYHFGFMG